MKDLEVKIFNLIKERNVDWNEELIKTVCKDLNLTGEEFRMVFPKGLEGIVDYLFKMVDENMLSIADEDLYKLPIHIQVEKFLQKRFEFMGINREVTLKALNIKSCITYQLNHVASAADLIWSNVNHKSSGFDYYTRRMILAGVYSNCLLYFKKDVSKNDMEKYIKEQLKIVGEITKLKKKICRS